MLICDVICEKRWLIEEQTVSFIIDQLFSHFSECIYGKHKKKETKKSPVDVHDGQIS